jgi:hypothetical protein
MIDGSAQSVWIYFKMLLKPHVAAIFSALIAFAKQGNAPYAIKESLASSNQTFR